MSTAPALARSLHRRFNLHAPINLDPILAAEGLEVVEYRFAGELKESIYEGVIGLRPNLRRAEQRELISHALAHHFAHEGNHLCLDAIDPLLRPKQERQSTLFAQFLLMPVPSLVALLRKGYSLPELGEHFDITPKFVADFLATLKQHCPQFRL